MLSDLYASLFVDVRSLIILSLIKIDPDIVYLNSSSKVTVNLERKVHKDSLSSSVTMLMKMDAVGGTLDMHTYGISLASSFSTLSIADEKDSSFEVLASFVPTSTYNRLII